MTDEVGIAGCFIRVDIGLPGEHTPESYDAVSERLPDLLQEAISQRSDGGPEMDLRGMTVRSSTRDGRSSPAHPHVGTTARHAADDCVRAWSSRAGLLGVPVLPVASEAARRRSCSSDRTLAGAVAGSAALAQGES